MRGDGDGEDEGGGRIRRATLVDEIADRLKREILEGKWPPGHALPPERELAETYGVTRTSLKHALVRLEEMGLIKTRHGVGSIVQDVHESGGADLLKYLVSPDESRFLREILEARSLIAGGFVLLAARRRTAKQLDEMEKILTELHEQQDDPHDAQRLENDLVRALARASGNRAFGLLVNSVSAAYRLDFKTYVRAFEDGAWVHKQLRGILNAVAEGEEERARDLAQRYFEESARRVLAKARS